jgi:hypothetical protein
MGFYLEFQPVAHSGTRIHWIYHYVNIILLYLVKDYKCIFTLYAITKNYIDNS